MATAWLLVDVAYLTSDEEVLYTFLPFMRCVTGFWTGAWKENISPRRPGCCNYFMYSL